jgi:D-sedoheptulose 7-phosphate isomerase
MGKLAIATRTSSFASVIDSLVVTSADLNSASPDTALEDIVDALDRNRAASVFVIGNGGSAAVAAHIVNDFVNMGKLRALTLHDPSVLTCLANDYGYENAYARMVTTLARKGDMLIAISSSGKSKNICNAVEAAKAAGARTVTLSGFSTDNPLRRLGDVNIWVPSEDYGMVEIAHLFILHNLSDRLAQRQRARVSGAGALGSTATVTARHYD